MKKVELIQLIGLVAGPMLTILWFCDGYAELAAATGVLTFLAVWIPFAMEKEEK